MRNSPPLVLFRFCSYFGIIMKISSFYNNKRIKWCLIIGIIVLTFCAAVYFHNVITQSEADEARLPTVQFTKETTESNIPETVQVTKETTVSNKPDPVQVTEKTIPTPKPPEVATVDSPWLEYRANWNGQDLLLDINDETGLLTLLPEYRPRMLSKLHHPLTEVYLPFKERFDIMNKYCDELKIPSTQSMMLYDSSRMYFNDSYESVYCDVPKTSSRVWKCKYAQMHNISASWDPQPPSEERMIFSVGYHMIPHNMTAKRFQTFTKILVTRHPFNRLISGFNDKFSHHPLYVHGLSKKIIKKLYLTDLPDEVSEFMEKVNTNYSHMDTKTKLDILFQYMRLQDSHLQLITLKEFLQYLIVTWEEEGNASSFDHHWMPITELCLPCSFTYDILIEHDKIAEESQTVLDYLQRNNKQNPPLNFTEYSPKTSVDVCNNAFKTVPMGMRKKVFEIYKNDFALFGYKTDLANVTNLC